MLTRTELHIDGDRFCDSRGRRVFLRGVSVGGCTKSPLGSHTAQPDYLSSPVSFVNRPFPLSEADSHFSRLASYGLTVIRLLVTWEAIEHSAPGVYDNQFLDYIQKLVRCAGTHGLSIVIDPHQDAWSRWTGGDGAPKWTLEMVGFDLENLWETKAAVTHCEALLSGTLYPPMVWPNNYLLFAASTMFTIFFSGKRFAPKLIHSDGSHMQDFLQGSFCRAFALLARYLKDEPNVLGFEAMNEPHAGFVTAAGCRFDKFQGRTEIGWKMTPWEATQVANGATLKIPVWQGLKQFSRYETVNQGGKRVWREGVECTWKSHGVWASGKLLDPFYFNMKSGENFQTSHMLPFWKNFASAIREEISDSLIFTGPAIDLSNPRIHSATAEDRILGQVWAPHWYDSLTLLTRQFRSWLGFSLSSMIPVMVFSPLVARGFTADLVATKKGGDAVGPTVVGEIGVPWCGTADSTAHALDKSLAAAERAGVDGVIIWNYAPSHSSELGDCWNGEDLSIYSEGELRIPTAVRPYVKCLSGVVEKMMFDFVSKRFELFFTSSGGECVESEIYIPRLHFPSPAVSCVGGEWRMQDQILIFTRDSKATRHSISVRTWKFLSLLFPAWDVTRVASRGRLSVVAQSLLIRTFLKSWKFLPAAGSSQALLP